MKKIFIMIISLVFIVSIFSSCVLDADISENENSYVSSGSSDSTESTDSESSSTDNSEDVTNDYFEDTRIELVNPDPTKAVNLTITDAGNDIYQLPGNGNGGWRYGPSYIYYGDGRVDAYFASGGDSGEWDRITHRSSTDDGKTWSKEKIVVYPTPDGFDSHSCCDPAAIYFDGYYYVGYTSTLNDGGYCNSIFVARSKDPDGPFEKWNGSGWGGSPEPVIYFDQSYGYWGIGEPSFIELNGTLYIYYTYSTPMNTYLMHATADATDENWPATLQYHGVAFEKKTDSVDVKYVEEWGKFIGVSRADYTGNGTWLAVFESNDGKNFTLVDAVRENTCPNFFGVGLSSRPNGHIRISEDAEHLRIAYAYGNSGWAAWNTRIHNVTLELSDGNDIEAELAKTDLGIGITREEEPYGAFDWTMLRTEKDLYIMSLKDKTVNLELFLRDRYVNPGAVSENDPKLKFSGFDRKLLSFDGLTMTAKGVGETKVTAHYGDLVHVFKVIIVETNNEKTILSKKLTVEPVSSDVTIYIGERSIYRPQLRVRITKGDGTVEELYVNDGENVLSFTGYDESIIKVSDKGVVTAYAVGKTKVLVEYKSYSFEINVTVSDNPDDSIFKIGEVKETNYTSLDFKKEEDRIAVSHFQNCQMSSTSDGLCITVSSPNTDPNMTDPSFKVVYQGAIDPIMTENYKTVEIVYMIPKENSEHTTAMELFIGTGSVMDAMGGYSVIEFLERDGEYHTLEVPVSHLNYWNGQLNMIRFDFFTSALAGDSIYISSISLK